MGTRILWTQPDQAYGEDHHTGNLNQKRRQLVTTMRSEVIVRTQPRSTFLCSRRTSSACGACSSPANTKCFCSRSARRVAPWQKSPASTLLPAPPSRPRIRNTFAVLYTPVRQLELNICTHCGDFRVCLLLLMSHTFRLFSFFAHLTRETRRQQHGLRGIGAQCH